MANKNDEVVEEVRLLYHNAKHKRYVGTKHAVRSAPCDIAPVAGYNGVFCEDTTRLSSRQCQVCNLLQCTSVNMQKNHSKKKSDVSGNLQKVRPRNGVHKMDPVFGTSRKKRRKLGCGVRFLAQFWGPLFRKKTHVRD